MKALALLSSVLSPIEVDRLRKLVDPPSLAPIGGTLQRSTCHGDCCQNAASRPVEETSGCLACSKRVVDAETKLLKQKELLGETERNIEELDDSIADLAEKNLALSVGSPLDFSQWMKKCSLLKEDQESSDDPTRGLGRWFKVVKPENNMRFEKLGKSMLLEKE